MKNIPKLRPVVVPSFQTTLSAKEIELILDVRSMNWPDRVMLMSGAKRLAARQAKRVARPPLQLVAGGEK